MLCLFCFILCRYLFNLPSFTRTFWFISSSLIVFSFFSVHVLAFFLCFIILACFRRVFFIYVSSRISHPGFDFFFVLLLFYFCQSFSHPFQLIVFRWSLNESNSSLVSKTLLSILADLNNVVIWIVSTRPFISKCSGPSTNPLVTVPKAPFTISISVTFMVNVFFSVPTQGLGSFLSFRFLSILLAGHPGRQSQQIGKLFFFFFCLLTIIRSRRLAKIKWSVCISKSQSSLCVSFSRTDSGFVRLILQDGFWVVRMVKFKLLAQFPVGHLLHPVVSSLILFLG